MPEHLKEKPEHPEANTALNMAFKKAFEFEDSGDLERAINAFQEFIDKKYPDHFTNIAKLEIKRLRKENT